MRNFEYLGPALRKLRLEEGLEHKDLSRLAGIPIEMIASHEDGESHPSIKTLDRVLTVQGKDFLHLCCAMDEVAGQKEVGDYPDATVVDLERAVDCLQLGELEPEELEAFKVMLEGFRSWLIALRAKSRAALSES